MLNINNSIPAGRRTFTQSLVAAGLASGGLLSTDVNRVAFTISPGTAGRCSISAVAAAVLDTGISIPAAGQPVTVTTDMVGRTLMQGVWNIIAASAGNVALLQTRDL